MGLKNSRSRGLVRRTKEHSGMYGSLILSLS
jgi:hypothetical protein